MANIKLNFESNLYEVFDDNNIIVGSYMYRSQAKDHLECLMFKKEFIPRSLEEYQELR
jgi:hypothetical protein